MPIVTISDHVRQRMQQQSIPPELVDLLVRQSDIEFDVGNGNVALRLSWRAHRRLQAELCADVADKVKDIVLIVRGDMLVTAMRAAGAPSRLYRPRRKHRRAA